MYRNLRHTTWVIERCLTREERFKAYLCLNFASIILDEYELSILLSMFASHIFCNVNAFEMYERFF